MVFFCRKKSNRVVGTNFTHDFKTLYPMCEFFFLFEELKQSQMNIRQMTQHPITFGFHVEQ